MTHNLKITRIDLHQFQWQTPNVGADDDYNGFNLVYKPGPGAVRTGYVLQIHTDAGITGEFAGGVTADYAQMEMFTEYLIGRNPLHRELIYNDVKRALRKHDRMSIGLVDIALWDIAGKLYNAPVCELLGGYKRSLPAYASTYHGDENGGLDTPEAFADFAQQCKEMGYQAFKIHGWSHAPIRREVANVLAVRQRVGDDMDLMIDPACEYETFADALRVGRACDEANFFWYEDPFKDGGISIVGHRKLRQLIKTPILMGEHLRTLEPKVDAAVLDACDFLRVNPTYDLGITGAMKVAHAAEGLGLDVELHGCGPAQRHCMAAIRNTNYYELGLVHPLAGSTSAPVYADYDGDNLDSIDANGHVPVPTGPGLGVSHDWDFIEAHRTGKKTWS
jgi:L-alanine-DL-glutamate epimerase-like enolase superfamily enzyme